MKIKITNPIVPGNYADPEARFYDGKYWIYATHSLDFPDQKNLSAFSSTDLVNWEKHENIVDMSGYPWTWGAVWAPTIIEKSGKYYLIFATNDLKPEESGKGVGGLEIAVSDCPSGPFCAMLDHSLIGEYINDAQPIDAHLFKDDDGVIYLYFGGRRHCNVAVMNEAMNGFVPFSDGKLFHEITPKDYVEGPCMIKNKGIYYFMWSVGDWGTDSYGVYYTVAKSPAGPFEGGERILKSKAPIANGPGHHGYFELPDGSFVIVYHRRPYGDKWPNNRRLCIDRMVLNNGKIDEINMTGEWECEL